MPTEEIVDQSFESIPAQEEEPEKVEKFLKIGKWKIKAKILLLVGTGVVVLLVILATLTQTVFKPKLPGETAALPSPTPTPFEEKIASPSAYATDSAVLKVESELKSIDEKLQSTDLKEAGLNPPVLDMDVNFKE